MGREEGRENKIQKGEKTESGEERRERERERENKIEKGEKKESEEERREREREREREFLHSYH